VVKIGKKFVDRLKDFPQYRAIRINKKDMVCVDVWTRQSRAKAHAAMRDDGLVKKLHPPRSRPISRAIVLFTT